MKVIMSLLFFDMAFWFYLATMILYIGYWIFKKEWLGQAATVIAIVSTFAISMMLISRTYESGHAPFSNLYESMAFFVWIMSVAYMIMEFRYKIRVVGAFVMAIAFIAMFATSKLSYRFQDIQPLNPALQSIWFELHVFSAFIGYAGFGIAFGLGFMYLIKARFEEKIPPVNWHLEVLKKYAVFAGRARRKEYWYFFLFNTLIIIVLVIIDVVTGLFSTETRMGLLSGLYTLAVLIPGIAVGVRRLHDTNRSGWWLLIGLVPLVGGIVLLVFMVQDSQPDENQFGPNPKLKAIEESMKISHFLIDRFPSSAILDELSYKSVAWGFIFFTLGALILGAVWANKAWGTYWSWDPKETWSLITWFVYAAYLHARVTRGWRGKKAAYVAIFGFLSTVFLYWGVSFVLPGLHAYATR